MHVVLLFSLFVIDIYACQILHLRSLIYKSLNNKSQNYNNNKTIHALFYVIYFNITVTMYATVCCGLHAARFDCRVQCTVFQCITASVQCINFVSVLWLHRLCCMACLLGCGVYIYHSLPVRLVPAHIYIYIYQMTVIHMSSSATCSDTCSVTFTYIVNVCNNTLLHVG